MRVSWISRDCVFVPFPSSDGVCTCLMRFTSTSPTPPPDLIRTVPVTASQFGNADMVDLRISVDKTFIPAQAPAARSNDMRELGVRVFHAFVEPR